ncbi:hypothetical protein ASZ90_008959 [hydrocarbon metagenome]|uniref:Uncharacterized protein n=1 Tax=hydrocarbon metagenome TaxID=938273 RepID=A0A0W8FK80_9ZZZZ
MRTGEGVSPSPQAASPREDKRYTPGKTGCDLPAPDASIFISRAGSLQGFGACHRADPPSDPGHAVTGLHQDEYAAISPR